MIWIYFSPGKVPDKPKEEEWSETESDVVHLTVETFDQVLKAHSSVLIMFYAPCKFWFHLYLFP